MYMKTRTIRVFISSTFRDMNKERDYLNNVVFPQVRDYCERRFLSFIPIDLRWGITEEDSRNGLVLSTCLEEIDNSRPFFIGILGSRYGTSVDANALQQLRVKIQQHRSWMEGKVSEGASITEMEMEYGVLRNMDIPYASFFFRGDSMAIQGDYREKDEAAIRHLEQLKARIRSQKKYPVTEYTSIEQFGDAIKRQLIDMIETEFPPSNNDADDAILQKQESVLERRSRVLCDMSLEWKNFQEWVNDPSKKVLFIDGQAGVGTSTMLAYCCSQMRQTYSGNKTLYFDLDSVRKGKKPLDALFRFLDMEHDCC